MVVTVGRNDSELERVKAHLTALSTALPELIQRVRPHVGDRDLPDAEKEGQRLASFSAYLDHYGRQDSRVIGELDLRVVLAEAVALTGGEIEQKARFFTRYGAAPSVHANPRQLGQVFVSLLINAAQAIPSGAPADHYVGVELDTNDDGWARVAIADSGLGIPEHVLPHVFEALYSTKRGAGMGIGLAIVREVIQGVGGRVSGESTPGHGTLFVIELPPAP